MDRVGTTPPLARAKTINLSLLLRSGVSGVTPLPLKAQLVGVALGSQKSLFSSKSIVTVPDGLLIRDQKRLRNLPLMVSSLKMPKSCRSLLFGGIEPDTMVGFGSFSLVPWPKESSPVPDGLSAFTITPVVRSAVVPVPAPGAFVDQSTQGLRPSSVRFAPACAPSLLELGTAASISKLLPDSVCNVVHVVAATCSTGKPATKPELAMIATSARYPLR